MPSLELTSHILLWIMIILQGIFLLALARQIGFLHERYGSGGARVMNVGLDIGEPAPVFSVEDLANRKVTLGTERNKRTLLFFLSTGCSICTSLLPHLKRLIRHEGDTLEIKLVAFGTTPENAKKYAVEHSLLDTNMPLIVSDDLALQYKVTLAPYGIVVNQSGIVRAKGVINSRFDIESLLNAEEMNVSHIQQYLESPRLQQKRLSLSEDSVSRLGRKDSNLRMADSKSAALPLGDAPMTGKS